MIRRIAILVCIASVLSHCIASADERFARIDLDEQLLKRELASLDAWLEEHVRPEVVPGAGITIVHGDRIIYKRSFRQSLQRPYPILSFTKTFVAMATLQLAEEGRLKLDEPADQYLPGNLETSSFQQKPITIRHLLTHTSGIPDSGQTIAMGSLYFPRQIYPAGKKFQYSNPGYRIMGEIVEKASERQLYEVIRYNLLEPMQMEGTVAGSRINGASGMVSNVEDLTKYITMLINRGKFGEDQIIDNQSYTAMLETPARKAQCEYVEYRGIAWRIQTYKNKVFLLNHAALGRGVGGMIQVFPQHDLGFVFLSNPPDNFDGRFLHLYKSLRNRLNLFAARVGNMEIEAGTVMPCAIDTVPW